MRHLRLCAVLPIVRPCYRSAPAQALIPARRTSSVVEHPQSDAHRLGNVSARTRTGFSTQRRNFPWCDLVQGHRGGDVVISGLASNTRYYFRAFVINRHPRSSVTRRPPVRTRPSPRAVLVGSQHQGPGRGRALAWHRSRETSARSGGCGRRPRGVRPARWRDDGLAEHLRYERLCLTDERATLQPLLYRNTVNCLARLPDLHEAGR